MGFQFYCNQEFLYRGRHLNMHRIKNEPIKIGNLFYEYIEHTIHSNGEHECTVVILSKIKVEKSSYPQKYYEIDKVYK